MSDEGTMLLNLSLDAAKRLRRRYGDEKYGHIRYNTSFIGQAYIEAVDIDNYIDIALETKQCRSADVVELREATARLLRALANVHLGTSS